MNQQGNIIPAIAILFGLSILVFLSVLVALELPRLIPVKYSELKSAQQPIVSPTTSSTPTPPSSSTPFPSTTPVIQNQSLLSEAWDLGKNIYISPKMDISFEYPVQFEFIPTDSYNRDDSKYVDISIYSPGVSRNDAENSLILYVDVLDNQGLNVPDYINKNYSDKSIDGKALNTEVFLPNLNKVSTPNNESYVYFGRGGGETPKKIIFFTYKDKLYMFSLVGGAGTGGQYSQPAEQLFDQIISSIKFL